MCVCVRTIEDVCAMNVSCIFIFHHFYSWANNMWMCTKFHTMYLHQLLGHGRPFFWLISHDFCFIVVVVVVVMFFFSLSFFNENRIITIASIVHSIDNTVTLNRWCCNEIGSSCSTSCRPYRTKVEHFRRIQSIRRWKSFDNSTNRPTAKCGASAVPGL